MGQQLTIPLFPPDLMEKVKEAHRLQEVEKLRQIIEHQTHVIAGFKGYRTKRKKSKNMIHNYPQIEQVKEASRYEICKWYRHLRSPENQQEEVVMNLICERYKELGGFTPELSKQIGW